MKSVSRDEIINGNLMGLFLVYSNNSYAGSVGVKTSGELQVLQDELKVRFEKLGYPYDLSQEGYGEKMQITGLLLRENNGLKYTKAKNAPFMRGDIPNTETGWVSYIDNLFYKSRGEVELITNFSESGVWGPNDWRMIKFTGVKRDRWVAGDGIINWGRRKIPISSRKGEK